jgi:hypothetical protein
MLVSWSSCQIESKSTVLNYDPRHSGWAIRIHVFWRRVSCQEGDLTVDRLQIDCPHLRSASHLRSNRIHLYWRRGSCQERDLAVKSNSNRRFKTMIRVPPMVHSIHVFSRHGSCQGKYPTVKSILNWRSISNRKFSLPTRIVCFFCWFCVYILAFINTIHTNIKKSRLREMATVVNVVDHDSQFMIRNSLERYFNRAVVNPAQGNRRAAFFAHAVSNFNLFYI